MRAWCESKLWCTMPTITPSFPPCHHLINIGQPTKTSGVHVRVCVCARARTSVQAHTQMKWARERESVCVWVGLEQTREGVGTRCVARPLTFQTPRASTCQRPWLRPSPTCTPHHRGLLQGAAIRSVSEEGQMAEARSAECGSEFKALC
jgi:hypothetical protein